MQEEQYFYKPLSAWIKRTHPLPLRFYSKGVVDKPKIEWSTWLSIEEVAPLYKAKELSWLGLKESRKNTQNYVNHASDIINGLEGGWLDREEQELILEKLGEPPLPSLPIYIISVKDLGQEKVVYVGKTENKSRFNGGHSVALKLQAPKYEGKEKKIYRSTVWFHDDCEYLSLDWIQPENVAIELLDSVESHLIFHFQPELNVSKKKKNYSKWSFYIYIQNFLEGQFLNDKFI